VTTYFDCGFKGGYAILQTIKQQKTKLQLGGGKLNVYKNSHSRPVFSVHHKMMRSAVNIFKSGKMLGDDIRVRI
jgi:hypothetical protein